jgi:hypothetical protein
MDYLDIWRAAQLLIRQRDDPELFATQRVDDMIEAGDARGEALWKQILTAIRKLQTTTPDGGQRKWNRS